MKQSSRRYLFLGISSLLAVGLIAVLVSVKYRVLDLEEELVRLNREIVSDRQAIHVLKAEWSHLNDPKRLSLLARRHLGLRPVAPEQMGTLASLPMRTTRLESSVQSTLRRIPASDAGNQNGVAQSAQWGASRKVTQ